MSFRDLVPWHRGHGEVEEAGDPFTSLQREMNRMFEDFGRGLRLTPLEGFPFEQFSPSIDVSEAEDAVKVSAELPGLEEKDLELSLDGDVLTISGEKRHEHEDKDLHRVERSYGRFRRSVQLPCDVEADKVEASFAKGVLTVSLPKTQGARERTRRIQVKSS